MKIKLFLLVFVLSILPLVNAYNVEVNVNSNLNDFNTAVYGCSTSECSTISFYDLINSKTTKNIYDLIGSGDKYYLGFDYKECYAPHIYRNHVWDSYSSKEIFSITLAQKSECKALIDYALMSENEINLGESITITTNVDSAFGYPSGIPTTTTIPESIYEEYSSNTKIELYANDVLVDSKESEILIGTRKEISFSWKPSSIGNYEIKIKTIVNDCACSTQNTQEEIIGNLIVSECFDCEDDLDCDSDYNSSKYCYNGNSYFDFHDFSCVDGNCVEEVIKKLFMTCQEDYCEDYTQNYCKNDDVYHKRTCYDNGCLSGQCFSNANEEESLVQECSYGCFNGECNSKPGCEPLIVFGIPSEWENVTECRIDNTILQTRTIIEYDYNNCGSFENITYYENRTISCIYSEENDTISSISNLRVHSKSYNYIKWIWDNPSEESFYKNIIYLDGVNVINTSNNYYKALNLKEDTSYKITVHTLDIYGRINDTDVSNIARTKDKSRNDDNDKENKEFESLVYFGNETQIEIGSIVINDKDYSSLENNFNNLWLLIILVILLIAIAYLSYLILKRM